MYHVISWRSAPELYDLFLVSGISAVPLNTERNVHFAKGTFLSCKEDFYTKGS